MTALTFKPNSLSTSLTFRWWNERLCVMCRAFSTNCEESRANVFTGAVILKWQYESEGSSANTVSLSLSLCLCLTLSSICAHTTFFLLFFPQIISDADSSTLSVMLCLFPSLAPALIKEEAREHLKMPLCLYGALSLPLSPLITGWENVFKSESLFLLSSSWQNDKANLLIRSFDSL